MKRLFTFAAIFVMVAHGAHSAPFGEGIPVTNSVFIEDLTWVQVRDRIQSGSSIAIIPTGGTEQNGPHMVIGKHNYIVHYTAGEIARKLGNALVAPVMSYVPEGRISPPEGHMQFPGTISVRAGTYEMLLEDAARSLKQAGFKTICFIGDSGGNQQGQQSVATRLTDEWRSEGVRVLHVGNYYSGNSQDRWVESMGIKVIDPSNHAGFADTSELMAVHAAGVNDNQRGARAERDYTSTGAMGDSTLSSAKYGQKLLNLKIETAVEKIQNASASAR
ncbi:MAG: creatininase family protein [Alphaproteobacteria bacterium]|nr:creatininase family protein [Alphaproteobacteria bacterium]